MSDSNNSYIYKIHHDKDFTTISNNILYDKRISAKATCYLCIMLSFPSHWKIHLTHLATLKKEGLDAVESALKELKKFGYVYMRKRRNTKGQLQAPTYLVSEIPMEKEEFKKCLPQGDFPRVDFPRVDNPPLVNTKEEVKIKEEVNTLVVPLQPTISFCFRLNRFTGIDEAKICEWKEAFPKIDIAQEIEKATEWVALYPTRNKRRKNWLKFFETQWFQRATESEIARVAKPTKADEGEAIYAALKPLDERYQAWRDRLNDAYLLGLGSLVLTKDGFHEYNNQKFKYKLSVEKYKSLLIEKYKVPEYVIKGL